MKRIEYFLLVGILAIQVFLLINLKFTAWPEMTLWPYLITKGWLPYTNIAIAHTPLMLIDLSIFYKLFGTGIWQLKLFTWILILLFDGLVFYVVRKIWNTKTALLALGSFVVWNLFYDGNGLWFDLYMGILAFCSFYFVRKKDWFWTGVFWALAFFSKQTAIWFLLPIGYSLIKSLGFGFKNVWKVVKGVLVVSALFVLISLVFGIMSDFWNWAVKFGVFVLPKSQGQIQLPDLKTLLLAAFPFSIFLLLSREIRKTNLDLFFWGFAGVLGAYPRFELFHFQPSIPFLAIISALVFVEIKKTVKPVKIFVVLYILISTYLFAAYFMRNYREGTRFFEANVSSVVSFVKYNTGAGDRVFVLNWWDNIYGLTDTLPAVDPWVPQLPWYMELPGIQERMVADLENNSPKLIIYSPYNGFGLSSYIPEEVYNYVMENYKISQRVDNLEILIRK